MKIQHLLESAKPDMNAIFAAALPIIVKELGLKSLPEIKLVKHVQDTSQPTFGRYDNEEHNLTVGLNNRHPLDIIRTLAHELVHYKQDIEGRLDDMSGETGSPIENEANALAGIVMRNLNKKHPEFFNADPIQLP